MLESSMHQGQISNGRHSSPAWLGRHNKNGEGYVTVFQALGKVYRAKRMGDGIAQMPEGAWYLASSLGSGGGVDGYREEQEKEGRMAKLRRGKLRPI